MAARRGESETRTPPPAGHASAERTGAPRQPTAFGAQLRLLRQRAGLSQEALAERAQLSAPTVAALEQGLRHRPHLQTAAALGDALGLDPTERAQFLQLAAGAAGSVADVEPGARPGRSSVPRPPTSLIGRDQDVARVCALLDPAQPVTHLLTLLGPGGVGKTRVALAVAAELLTVYADGAVFVDLAPLRDPRLVPAAIARALEVREGRGRSARELVLEHLRERQLLLVLDNFEHLLGAAPLVADLLQQCPHLVALVTSRTALRLQGEQRLALPPLATPPAADAAAAGDLQTWPAVRLFIARAQAVVPSLALDRDAVDAMAAICRRLDGMPLAIELAAARAGLLPPAALLRRLERRLPLLVGGAANLPERQQTLRQALAWSLDLLGPPERVLFRRLGVFVGGWTLDAAEAVCAAGELPPDEVLDRLQVLLDSSLVQPVDATPAEPRFGMLETIREFAHDQLAASGEAASIQHAHARYTLALVEAIAPRLAGPEQVHWTARLLAEQDNVRAAFRWLLAAGEFETLGRLIRCLDRFWWASGQITEARQSAAAVLARGAEVPPTPRARAAFVVGSAALLQGDAAAAALLAEARLLALAADDAWPAGFTLLCEGAVLAPMRGDLAAGVDLLRQAQPLLREAGDDWGFEQSLAALSAMALFGGQPDEAERYAQEHRELAQARGDLLSLTQAWEALMLVALVRQDLQQAALCVSHELPLALAVGQPDHLATALEGLAVVTAQADPPRAARCFAAAAALRAAHGLDWVPTKRMLYEPALHTVRAALSAADFDAAWAAGQAMTREQVAEYALEPSTTPR